MFCPLTFYYFIWRSASLKKINSELRVAKYDVLSLGDARYCNIFKLFQIDDVPV